MCKIFWPNKSVLQSSLLLPEFVVEWIARMVVDQDQKRARSEYRMTSTGPVATLMQLLATSLPTFVDSLVNPTEEAIGTR